MILYRLAFIFFFSSRRRHTRYWRDWSSDVCSSDLIAQVVGRTARKSRHGIELQAKYRLVIDERGLDNLLILLVPCPHLGTSQGRLTRLRGLVGLDVGQLEGQAFLGNHAWHAILIIYGERLTPVALA